MVQTIYDIVMAHGGELMMETKESEARRSTLAGTDGDDPVGRGSEFIIQLPVS